MKRIDNIKEKIKQIEEIIYNIKSELDELNKESEIKTKKLCPKQIIPKKAELMSEYEKLYAEFAKLNTKVIEDFIKNKDKTYLKSFCKANNLPIDTSKYSKEKIADEVMKWMSQRKAITKKTT